MSLSHPKALYLFLERREGREKERKRNIKVQLPLQCPLLGTRPATQACALPGNQSSDPLVHRPAFNPLSHSSQGTSYIFKALARCWKHQSLTEQTVEGQMHMHNSHFTERFLLASWHGIDMGFLNTVLAVGSKLWYIKEISGYSHSSQDQRLKK